MHCCRMLIKQKLHDAIDYIVQSLCLATDHPTFVCQKFVSGHILFQVYTRYDHVITVFFFSRFWTTMWSCAKASALGAEYPGSNPGSPIDSLLGESSQWLLLHRTLDGDACRPHESDSPPQPLQAAIEFVPQWYWFCHMSRLKASCSWQCCGRCSAITMSALHRHFADSPVT